LPLLSGGVGQSEAAELLKGALWAVPLARRMVIASDLKAARKAERRLLSEVARHGYNGSTAFAIRLAVEEALNNAIKHGNCCDASKVVELIFDISPQQAVITIGDQGDGFDPASVPDPTVEENLEKPYGRGIMLMRAYMDEVNFNEQGNQVRMVKHNARGS